MRIMPDPSASANFTGNNALFCINAKDGKTVRQETDEFISKGINHLKSRLDRQQARDGGLDVVFAFERQHAV